MYSIRIHNRRALKQLFYHLFAVRRSLRCQLYFLRIKTLKAFLYLLVGAKEQHLFVLVLHIQHKVQVVGVPIGARVDLFILLIPEVALELAVRLWRHQFDSPRVELGHAFSFSHVYDLIHVESAVCKAVFIL